MTARHFELYQEFATIPEVKCGHVIDDGSVQVVFSQRDLVASTRRTFERQTDSERRVATRPIPTLPFVLRAVSRGHGLTAYVRKVDDSHQSVKGERKLTVLEIWDDTHMCSTTRLTQHGAVYGDPYLGSLEWSPDGSKLAYIAEPLSDERAKKQRPSFVEHFDSQRQHDASETTESSVDMHKPGRTFEFDEDWGEQYDARRRGVVFVFDRATRTVEQVRGVNETLACGQVTWTDDSRHVVFAAFETEPRRLGLIYCYNRASRLFVASIESDNCRELFAAGASDRRHHSPTLSPSGSHMVFLSNASALTHGSAMRLNVVEWDSENQTTKGEPRALFDNLFSVALRASSSWLDDTRLAVSLQRYSRSVIALIDVSAPPSGDGHPTYLTACEPERLGGDAPADRLAGFAWSILDVSPKHGILVAVSSPLVPPTIGFVANDSLDKIEWVFGEDGPVTHPKLRDWTFRVVRLTADGSEPFEGIVVLPHETSSSRNVPLVAYPHGGPHSSWNSGWINSIAFFVALGYGFVLCNYRGSLGWTQALIDSLTGAVGTRDVNDCIALCDAALALGCFDSSRQAVMGGSHGGFLTAHLTSQFPTRFKAALLRNPVTNIATMVGASDIPDWCLVEALGVAECESLERLSSVDLSAERLSRMYLASPIRRVASVVTPSIVVLGRNDRRVPPSQGMEWFYALKTRGVPIRLFRFDDPHAITRVDSEIETWLNGALWFDEHVRK